MIWHLEAVADDVSQKVGEMERFMEMSASFMDSVDLQNGVFEEEGYEDVRKMGKRGRFINIWVQKKILLILEGNDEGNVLDLNEPVKRPMKADGHKNQYDSFFE